MNAEIVRSGGNEILSRLYDQLRDRQLLLVLDNFEQVTDAVGLVTEGQKGMKEAADNQAILDCMIAGAASKVEHYEIASYRGLISGAAQMGNNEIVRRLQQNLKQEEQTAQRIVYTALENNNSDVWMLDAGRGATRITATPINESLPHWSPDGRYIVFSRPKLPGPGYDTWMLPASGDGKPVPLLDSPFDKVHARISPDGRWIALAAPTDRAKHIEKEDLWVVPAGGGRAVNLTAGFDEDAHALALARAASSLDAPRGRQTSLDGWSPVTVPNAWNAGCSLVAVRSNPESCLRISNPTAPSRAPASRERFGVCGFASSRKSARNRTVLTSSPIRTASAHSSGPSASPRSRASRICSDRRPTRPETPTLSSSTAPTVARVTTSRSLPITNPGCSKPGSSKTISSASRMLESQPSPA